MTRRNVCVTAQGPYTNQPTRHRRWSAHRSRQKVGLVPQEKAGLLRPARSPNLLHHSLKILEGVKVPDRAVRVFEVL